MAWKNTDLGCVSGHWSAQAAGELRALPFAPAALDRGVGGNEPGKESSSSLQVPSQLPAVVWSLPENRLMSDLRAQEPVLESPCMNLSVWAQ